MRYITDTDGYVKEVSWGADISCGGQDCTDYTGTVPTGYTSLEDWYTKEGDKLYRWKIVDGELTLDSSATAPTDKLPAADYVVEQGTSGIWTFRKWNSGLAEVWLTNHQTLTNCPLNGSLMGGYYAQMNNPPFGNFPVTFTSTPTVTGHGALGSGLGFATIGVSQTHVTYVAAAGNDNSTAINRISIKLIGRWK